MSQCGSVNLDKWRKGTARRLDERRENLSRGNLRRVQCVLISVLPLLSQVCLTKVRESQTSIPSRQTSNDPWADRFYKLRMLCHDMCPIPIHILSKDTHALLWEVVLEPHFIMSAEACLFLEPQYLRVEDLSLFCPQTFKLCLTEPKGQGNISGQKTR